MLRNAEVADLSKPDIRSGALPTDRLWTQHEAAHYLSVSARYLRESGCPKVLLPGCGPKQQPVVRYDPAEVKEWQSQWHTSRAAQTDRPRRIA